MIRQAVLGLAIGALAASTLAAAPGSDVRVANAGVIGLRVYECGKLLEETDSYSMSIFAEPTANGQPGKIAGIVVTTHDYIYGTRERPAPLVEPGGKAYFILKPYAKWKRSERPSTLVMGDAPPECL